MWWARRNHGWQDSSSYTREVDFLGEVLEIHILVTEASEELLDVFLLFGHEFQLSQFISVVLSLAAEVASHFGAEQGERPSTSPRQRACRIPRPFSRYAVGRRTRIFRLSRHWGRWHGPAWCRRSCRARRDSGYSCFSSDKVR